MVHLGDITKINGYEVPTTDVVVGGSPCQDLSVAGLRKGMQHSTLGDEETTRSGLFMEQIRLVKEMRDADRKRRGSDVDIRPRYMLWENVPGAFSSNKGEDFRVVLEEVARINEEGVTIPRPEKGKWTNAGVIMGDSYSIAWRVFDAQYWGVSQRRRRICLVADFNGHSAAEIVFNEDKQYGCSNRRDDNASFINLGDESGLEIQPICESLSRDSEQGNEKRKTLTEDVGRSTETGYPAFTYQDREGKPGGGKGGLIQEDKATSLRTNNYMTVFQPMNEPIVLESNQNHATITQTGVCPTLNASMGLGGGYVPMVTQPDLVMYQREFGGKVTENPTTSPTLEAAMGEGGNNQPILSYAIDMGDGKSACDIIEDKSPTLCTTHYGEPAVCFSAHGFRQYDNMDAVGTIMCGQNETVRGDTPLVVQTYNGNGNYVGDVAPAMRCSSGNDLHLLPVVSMDRETFNTGQNFAKTLGVHEDGIQPTLVAKGPGAVCYAEGFDAYYQASTGDVTMSIRAGSGPEHTPCVLTSYWDGGQVAGTLTANNANGNQRMPDKENFNCVIEVKPLGLSMQSSQGIDSAMEEIMPTLKNGTNPGWQNGVCEKYPDLQETTGSLMASGYEKQGTQEACNGMYVVAKDKVRYIVRRLTPLECERLQGYPDGWTDIGEWVDDKGKTHKLADSNRYKALGNSIALPSWRWVMRRMSAQYERPATLASLFDGIGGFPLIWEGINGKGTCLWASEIEDFPMAVTKRRFG